MDLSQFPISDLLKALGQGMVGAPNIGVGFGRGAGLFGQQMDYNNALKSAFGSPQFNDVQVTPQVTLGADGQINRAPPSAYNTPAESYSGPLGQMLGNSSSALLPLLQHADPSVGLPLLLSTYTKAAERQQDRQDKMMNAMTPEEISAAGLPKGTVAQKDAFGGINIVSKPDYMSDDAFKQHLDLLKIQQGPEWANVSLGRQRLAEQKREFDSTASPSGDNAAGVEYWAQQVAAGGAMPTLGMGKQAAAMRQQILNRAAAINGAKGLTGADQLAITAGAKSGSSALSKITPLRAATEAYENTMMQNIGLAKQYMAKGAGTTGVPVLNRWQQYAKGQYAGDPDVAKFQTAIQTIKNEYAKIQSGSIGNAPVSDAARREAEGMLDPNQTPAQLMANFDYMVKETGNRTRALRATEQAIKSGLSGKGDIPQLQGVAEPQAQQAHDPLGIRGH